MMSSIWRWIVMTLIAGVIAGPALAGNYSTDLVTYIGKIQAQVDQQLRKYTNAPASPAGQIARRAGAPRAAEKTKPAARP